MTGPALAEQLETLSAADAIDRLLAENSGPVKNGAVCINLQLPSRRHDRSRFAAQASA